MKHIIKIGVYFIHSALLSDYPLTILYLRQAAWMIC